MKTRIAVAVIAMSVFSPSLWAQDSDKLDAILQELKTLSKRVERLERKVDSLSNRELSAMKVIEIDPAQNPIRLPHMGGLIDPGTLRPSTNREVDEVIRMQFESPGSLLKDIHGREERLRRRMFLPEYRH